MSCGDEEVGVRDAEVVVLVRPVISAIVNLPGDFYIIKRLKIMFGENTNFHIKNCSFYFEVLTKGLELSDWVAASEVNPSLELIIAISARKITVLNNLLLKNRSKI